MISIQILGIRFKIDSRAEHMVIPGNIALTVLKDAQLKSTEDIIHIADKTPFKLVIGKLFENIEFDGKNSLERMYVINCLQTCLLGKSAFKVFGIASNIQRRFVISVSIYEPLQEFLILLKGLVLLIGNYHIELIRDTKPYIITSLRRIPIPLLEKTKVKRMQELNDVKPIETVTDYCLPGVVTRKR